MKLRLVYGAGFEYNTNAQPFNTLENYIAHTKHGLFAGQYTDDTQMSLAIAEAIVEDDEWTPLSLAQRFCDVFHRDVRPGYAGGFYKFLAEHTDGSDFRDIRPDSDKSGGAMRLHLLVCFQTFMRLFCEGSCRRLSHTILWMASLWQK